MWLYNPPGSQLEVHWDTGLIFTLHCKCGRELARFEGTARTTGNVTRARDNAKCWWARNKHHYGEDTP